MAFKLDDVEQTILIKVNSKTDQAESGIKKMTKTIRDEFGVTKTKITEFNKATGESFSYVTKEGEKWGDKIADFAKKNQNALMAVAAAAKLVKEGFDLALFAAKRSNDEQSRQFMNSYNNMIASVDRLKEAIGKTLIPAFTVLADVLGGIANTVAKIVDTVSHRGGDNRGVIQEGSVLDMWMKNAPFQQGQQIRPGSAASDLLGAARSKASLAGYAAGQIWHTSEVLRLMQEQSAAFGGESQGLSDIIYKGKRDELMRLAKGSGASGKIDIDRFKLPNGRTIQEEIDRIALELIGAELQSISREKAGIDEQLSLAGKKREFYDRQTQGAFRRSALMGGRTAAGMEEASIAAMEDEAIASRNRILERSEGQKFLESVFGPIQTFSVYEAAFKSLGDVTRSTWDVTTQAISAGVDAWITGQEKVGKAIKMAIAEALRATAIQMTVEALKNTALGAAALFFNPAAAGGYFTAAAIAGSAAAAAAVGAKALGGSTGQWKPETPSAAASAGSAVRGIGAGAPSGGGGNHITVIAGDSIYEVSARRRRAMFGRAVDYANRSFHGSTALVNA